MLIFAAVGMVLKLIKSARTNGGPEKMISRKPFRSVTTPAP